MALVFISLHAQAKDGHNLVAKESGGVGKRVALVIGNGDYQHTDSLPKLANPPHDAEDIAKALRGFGFEVIEKKDQSLEGMNDAIAEFSRKITDSNAALFYFAGRGLQVKGQNYLIPVDAKIESEAQVPFKSININQLLEEMDNGHSRANIVMLDACRNNPISGKFRSGATRGLAAPTSQPKGTVIVYATDPGNVAADGTGRNGLFTAGLLTAFKSSGLSLHGVLVRASKEVERGSEKKQTPYINDPATLQEEFQFAPGQGTQIASLAPTPVPAGGGVSLDDIKKQQEARGQWNKWQQAMKADYDKVASLNAEADLQITAWERFLANYAQDNPFSTEDEALRAQAQNRKQSTQAQQQRATEQLQPQKQEAKRQQQRVIQIEINGPVMIPIPGKNYEIGKFEVSQAEWRAVMGNNPSKFSDCGETCPVEQVNWDDAQEFIQKLNAKTGKQYRLPTEAEWEHACFGGKKGEYCGGNDLNAVAWFESNSDGQTHPAGQKQANGYGLYDMSGNVWELTNDCKDEDCTRRAHRGGSWVNFANFLRAAVRNSNDPDRRLSYFGFRVARTLP